MSAMAVETSRPFPTCSGMSRVVAIPSPLNVKSTLLSRLLFFHPRLIAVCCLLPDVFIHAVTNRRLLLNLYLLPSGLRNLSIKYRKRAGQPIRLAETIHPNIKSFNTPFALSMIHTSQATQLQNRAKPTCLPLTGSAGFTIIYIDRCNSLYSFEFNRISGTFSKK